MDRKFRYDGVKILFEIESLEDMADQSDRYFVERTELYRENQEKGKEIERLNNIIDELEKWLEEKQDLTCGCGITPEYIYAYENCLDKLRELKEGK